MPAKRLPMPVDLDDVAGGDAAEPLEAHPAADLGEPVLQQPPVGPRLQLGLARACRRGAAACGSPPITSDRSDAERLPLSVTDGSDGVGSMTSSWSVGVPRRWR